MTESTIYWITRMDYLHEGTFILGLVFVIAALIAIFVAAMEDKWRVCKQLIPLMVFGVILALSSGFIPTTKEMCAIKAIPVIVNNEQVQELPNKVVELANEWIDELKPNKED